MNWFGLKCVDLGKFNVTGDDCFWSQFYNAEDRMKMAYGCFFTVMVATFCTIWMNSRNDSALAKRMVNPHSYKTLSYFFLAMQLRIAVTFLARFDYLNFFKINQRVFDSCRFFAFLDNFLTILEMETLTHACIERFVVTRYISNDWLLVRRHYTLYKCLSLMFATFYSVLTLSETGAYGHDFDCTCALNMIQPSILQLTVFFGKSIKPTMFMITMITRAILNEQEFDMIQKRRADPYFTEVVKRLMLVNLACWSPLALLRGSVLMSQHYLGNFVYVPPAGIIGWAYNLTETAPVLSAAILYLAEQKALQLYPEKRTETVRFAEEDRKE